jgi:uncharacterized protein (TIGR00730 family)
MTTPLRSIAVFCASSDGSSPRWREHAAAFGSLLARRGITVVYGGGRVGLMGAVADGALTAGGKVIGVIPRAMIEAERGHTGLTELRVVTTMHERKQLMVDLSDGFVALPGGYGTFDELFEAITWAQLGIHRKPVGLLNADDFWTPLLTFLDGVTVAGFIKPTFRGLVKADADATALLDAMARHQPPSTAGWARPEER